MKMDMDRGNSSSVAAIASSFAQCVSPDVVARDPRTPLQYHYVPQRFQCVYTYDPGASDGLFGKAFYD